MVKADDIFLFVNVVDDGSFSKVAEKLELTNSVVSKRIGRLEKALNIQLLYRTTRKLSLTDAGQALYGKARLAKLALQDAEDAVTGYANELKGTIKVTVPAVSAQIVLNTAAATFCQLHPKVNIELSVSNHLVDLIGDGYDLAIRTAHLEDSSLIARRLIDSQWIVCASPEYLRLHGVPELPEELKNRHCLVYRYDGKNAELWKFQVDGVPQDVKVEGRFNTNNLDGLRQASLANLGIAYLPRVLVHEDLVSGRLIPILEKQANKRLGVYAVHPRTRQPDKKLKLLIEHFRMAFQNKKEYFY